MFYTYILRLSNGKFYIGQTNNIQSRFVRHQTGQVRSTSHYRPLSLVYYEKYESRSGSVMREKQLKSWKSHKALEDLITNFYGPIV